MQVLGEISNKNQAWRKFAQTFFLAEQPNGYFVLNDIFRYLKEDSDEHDEGSEDVGPNMDSALSVTSSSFQPVPYLEEHKRMTNDKDAFGLPSQQQQQQQQSQPIHQQQQLQK